MTTTAGSTGAAGSTDTAVRATAASRLRLPVSVRLTGARPGDPGTPGRVHEAVVRGVVAGLADGDLAALGVAGPEDVVVLPPRAVAATGTGVVTSDVITPDVLEAARGGAEAGVDLVLRGLGAGGSASEHRPAGAATEALDRSRVRRRGASTTYRVPFFDGGEVELTLADDAPGTGDRVTPPLPAMREVLTELDAVTLAWVWHVHRNGPRWDPDAYGYPGFYGTVAAGGRTVPTLVWLTSVSPPIQEDGTFTGRYSYLFTAMTELALTQDADRPFADRLISASGVSELTPTDQTATVAALDVWIADALERSGRRDDPLTTDGELRRRYAERLLTDPDTGEVVEGLRIWRRHPGPTGALALLPPELDGQTVRGPIRFVSARAAGGTGGTGGSERTDRRAGGGTDREGDGRRGAQPAAAGPAWPSDGRVGTLTCAPFLAEPEHERLTDDHGLVERMRRIAGVLGIGECPYLGNFALVAGRTVAARARAVGVASSGSDVRTEVAVRPDGSGNNGYLEVRPGTSPELELLKVLAGAGVDVDRFSRDLITCYLDPRNRDVVRVDESWEPNAAGWALRFSGEALATGHHAFMHVYAETCRVLLLQQLRSSRAGIDGRLSSLDATTDMFAAALDAIGELVVQMSTLRLALRHSREVFMTGSVRAVLSVPRTVGHGRDRFTLPAPLTSVPARILDVVGDARVERRGDGPVVHFQGRAWTGADLDAAVGMRRAVLNQIDPLFFQVSDLEGIYARAQRDPGSVRTYLSGLLEEMREANEGMTGEASDPDDGSFFALEASKYVEREGGRDWRGLRFDLQGIHALAHEQLAAHVGTNASYIEGVNLAVGRKAAFDRFLALFATVGIIALGLLCAPLGVVAAAAITGAAGVALTVVDVLEARRQTDLYQAVLTPELLQRRADVEMAQLMAAIGIAFSIFDVFAVGRGARAAVRTVTAGGRAGTRAAGEAVVREGAEAATERAGRRLLGDVSEELMANAMRQAVSQAAVMAALDRLLPLVIAPVLVPWMRDVARERGVLGDVDAALGDLAVQHAVRELEASRASAVGPTGQPGATGSTQPTGAVAAPRPEAAP